MTGLATLLGLTLVACTGNAIEEDVPEEDAVEHTTAEVTCTVDIPAGQEVDDLVAILPTPAEVSERIEVGSCARALAGARSLFDTDEAAAALADSDLRESIQEGAAHYMFHPQGLTMGGLRARVIGFDDAGSAAEAVALLLPALIETGKRAEEPIAAVREIPSPGLGDASFGLRGSIDPANPGFDLLRLVWSRDQLVFDVTGWGAGGEPDGAPQDELLEIARAMDERAS